MKAGAEHPDKPDREAIRQAALDAGFSRARFLAPYTPSNPTKSNDNRFAPAPAALFVALPYPAPPLPDEKENGATIAPFARHNYYREATRRLQALAVALRQRWGGVRADFAALANSPVPEKPLAQACGLGVIGKNTLLITPETGSRVILAALTLPYTLEGDPPLAWQPCKACGTKPACAAACPTSALDAAPPLNRARCVQWYLSGHGETLPPEVAVVARGRFYGCTVCQDACPWNRSLQEATQAPAQDSLPALIDTREILAATDAELRARFKGTALGQAWLTPAALRRNASLSLLDKGAFLR
jgi:epoxyqueuosine reductase